MTSISNNHPGAGNRSGLNTKDNMNANELLYKGLEEFIANLSREEYLKHEAAFKEVQTIIHQQM